MSDHLSSDEFADRFAGGPPPDGCRSCRFWNPAPTAEWGLCRRRPPVLVDGRLAQGVKAVDASAFPATLSAQWCGEFEKRTTA
jgi:hypothetical protein